MKRISKVYSLTRRTNRAIPGAVIPTTRYCILRRTGATSKVVSVIFARTLSQMEVSR